MGRKNIIEFEHDDRPFHTTVVHTDELDRHSKQMEVIRDFKEDALECIRFQSHGLKWLNKFSYREWDDFLDTL